MNINIIEALSIIPRSLISLLCLVLVTIIIGKKQISQLSIFDYVIGISIGNFTAEMILVTDSQLINEVVAILVFGLSAYIVSILTMKSIVLRRFFSGTPTIIIYDGKIIEKSLKKVKIDVNDLLEQARISGYFNINDINYAIMEANGKISFMPKEEKAPVTKEDLDIKTSKSCLDVVAILDGKIMFNNLKEANIASDVIYQKLRIKKIEAQNVLLGVISNNELIIYPKNDYAIKKILE